MTTRPGNPDALEGALSTPPQERCSQHPADPLELVCIECFESDKTAAATERAELADADRDRLTAELAQVREERDAAVGYLTRLFSLVAPQCIPTHDLLGLCTADR